MRILVLNGSPKGGRSNTMRLTEAFIRGFTAQAQAEVEIIEVGKLHLKPCLGCFSCWKATPGKCCIDDDMASVIEKLCVADVLIWSFPLYYYGMPGPIKTLMDRMLPMTLPVMTERGDGEECGGHPSRYDLSRQRNVLISTCGFHTAKGNYDALVRQFDLELGKGRHTDLLCGQGELFRVPELKSRTDEYLSAVERAGAEYAGGGIAQDTWAQLRTPLYPREVFERMANADWGINDQGEKEEAELTFTRQMAALYNPASCAGKRRVVEMRYTDVGRSYQMVLDGKGPQVLGEDFLPATTVIETPFAVWKSISRGEIRGDAALMEGRYRVTGDFELMRNWDAIFSADSIASPKQETAPQTELRPTNMLFLLLPWMALWIALPIDAMWGGVACIAAGALLPLAGQRWQLTVYDRISGAASAIFGLASLLGAPVRWLVPAAYLAFGVMWLLSCLTRIPITAHYSKNQNGGDSALDNPLFIRTNRILSAAWGALYLVTPVWTYALMGTPWSAYSGAINSIVPLLMGAFTWWFQNWYPAHLAQRGAKR